MGARYPLGANAGGIRGLPFKFLFYFRFNLIIEVEAKILLTLKGNPSLKWSKRIAQRTGLTRLNGLIAIGLLAGLLASCGQDTPVPPLSSDSRPSNSTPAAPFPAKGGNPTATIRPTDDSARVFEATPPAPALFPTITPRPNQPVANFTVTAGLPAPQLTPTAIPTGQLAYVQAGNLWLIDDTGGNRRQLTESSDIGADSILVWNNTRDRLAYISRAGELWLLDLQGKRSLIFSPGRTARLAAPAKLPTTPQPATPPGATPRPPENTRSGPLVSAPVWSPDGRNLAFSYYAAESGPLASGEIWQAEIISDKAVLNRVGEGFGPTWSGDGRSLAFLSRAEVKQGQPRPTVDNTPQGTSLLPQPVATRAGSQQNDLPEELNALTPTLPGPTTLPTGPTTRPPTPTAFVIYPGGTPVNTPAFNEPPTATLNIQSLPSPTPTPTYPPVYLGTYLVNRIMTYTPVGKKLTPLIDSDKLPDAFYDTNNALRSYVPAPLQAVWWSPDNRFIAFADRLSVVGVLPLSGGQPVIWTGQPQNYSVFDLQWLPRSDGAYYRVISPGVEATSRITLVTFNNSGQAAGATGDVTNHNLIKIILLPGLKSSCPELSPGGNFFSYYDGSTLVLTNPDGSIHASYSDTDCPAWSPFGRSFASTRKSGDHTIILTTVDSSQERQLISARGVDRIYWLRSDPTFLGGPAPAPAPTLRP